MRLPLRGCQPKMTRPINLSALTLAANLPGLSLAAGVVLRCGRSWAPHGSRTPTQRQVWQAKEYAASLVDFASLPQCISAAGIPPKTQRDFLTHQRKQFGSRRSTSIKLSLSIFAGVMTAETTLISRCNFSQWRGCREIKPQRGGGLLTTMTVQHFASESHGPSRRHR
jgi:hypothetical protein